MDRESLIQELENAIQQGSSNRCTETIRRVTELFTDRSAQLNEEHIELFDDVILRLAAEIETKARAELARRLAAVENAPVRVMSQLAHDDEISVAAPVLVRSSRLSDEDLVQIAKTKSQAHLLALSNRRKVTEAVTDVLVDRGDSTVLFNVASNAGANFSEDGFATLVERAGMDDALAARVGQRPDVPQHLFRKLVSQASEIVQRRLLITAAPGMREEIQKVLAKVSHEIDPDTPPPHNFVAAQRMMRMLFDAGELGEDHLHDLAKSRRYEETVAALSILSRVPLDTVDWLMHGDRIEPFLILFKALGFEWLTVRAVIMIRPSGRKISAKEIEEICGDFSRLSYSTARRVIQHWQGREGMLRAG
jgi:uncharacterized protein (DUF2336 family)